jgi:hypothetical protein
MAELTESMAGTMDDPQMVGRALLLLERSLGGTKKQKEMGDPNEGDPSKMPEHDDSLDEGTLKMIEENPELADSISCLVGNASKIARRELKMALMKRLHLSAPKAEAAVQELIGDATTLDLATRATQVQDLLQDPAEAEGSALFGKVQEILRTMHRDQIAGYLMMSGFSPAASQALAEKAQEVFSPYKAVDASELLAHLRGLKDWEIAQKGFLVFSHFL